MSDTRIDLYLEWEQALNDPEVDAALVANLESKAAEIGLDLRVVNTHMLNSMTAAIWNPDLHPRGRDGKFIDVLGFVRLFDFVDRKGERHSESSGRVKSIKPDERNPGNPNVEVTLDDGSNVVVKPSQVATAPRSKARLRLGTEEGDTSPGANARRSIEQIFAEDPPLSSRQVREFEGRFDPLAQYEKKKTRIDAALDNDFRAPSDQELVEWERELQEARTALDLAEAPLERRPPGPRAFGEEGDLSEEFQEGVPNSIRDAYFAYQARERVAGRGDRLLDLDDWVESDSPPGGDEAPGPVRERFARTTYVETRDVGNLMVGDEIILPGDMPGVVESFEFPGDRPDSVIVHTDNGSYHGKTGDILPSFREGDDAGGPETNPIGEEVSVEPGELGSRDNPIRTADPLEAVTALHEGKYVELESVDQVSTLLGELADIANEAKAKGEKAPNYDLCLVTVPNTNLFCAESKGIPRIEMPQLGGIPVPGSRADELPKNDGGEVDIGPAFIRHLREKGVNVEETRKLASHLKASQSELVGVKVGGMMRWMEGGTEQARNTIRESSIFVTRDGYVVDGHHRWAAVVGLDAAEGGLDDLDMPVRVIDMDILDVLKEANDFAIEFGVPPQAAVASGVKVDA